MLASTVQFSNNDQPPITHHNVVLHWGRQPKDDHDGRTFRYPTACPTRPIRFHVPRRSSTSENPCAVPSSQRSTHELTTVEHLPT